MVKDNGFEFRNVLNACQLIRSQCNYTITRNLDTAGY